MPPSLRSPGAEPANPARPGRDPGQPATSFSGRAQVPGDVGPRPRDGRAPHPVVRRLPALGHGHLPVAPAVRPAQPVRPDPRDDHHHDDDDATVRPAAATTPRSPPHLDGSAPTAATFTLPPKGDAVALIAIPRIGVDQVVVEGVDVDDLRKGPGRYPATQMPGHEGTTAIAGHRTTYGAPFGDLDQLAPGDQIILTTVQGRFVYKVTETRVVSPDDGSVLQNVTDPANPGHSLATVTLTTCNPKYSAAERLVVLGSLVLPPGQSAPLPKAAVPEDNRRDEDRRTGRRDVVAHAGHPLGRARRADRPALVVVVPPLPALDHVDHRRGAVPRGAVRVLRVPRAAAAVELLRVASSISAIDVALVGRTRSSFGT